MTAKELRIGNLVSNMCEACAEIKSIVANDTWSGGFYVITDNNKSALSTLSPIKLTEEWLRKFGFTYQLSTYCDGNLLFKVAEAKLNNHIVLVPNDLYYLELKYVHQLQNLYFVLTGKELKITGRATSYEKAEIAEYYRIKKAASNAKNAEIYQELKERNAEIYLQAKQEIKDKYE